MDMKTRILFLTILSAVVAQEYSGYHIIETSPVPQDAASTLVQLLQLDPRFDLLSDPRHDFPVRILTAAENVHELRFILHRLGLDMTILCSDLEKVIEREREAIEVVRRVEKLESRAVTFDRYLDLNEIMAYLDELAMTYPNLVTLEDIGVTYEGRPIRGIRVSNGPGKRTVLMDSGMHAREWMGHALGLKVINEIVENPENAYLIDLLDWMIVPVLNPDGYNFTWTQGRMWRKNRKPNNGSNCVGTDPNRNFDFHWGAIASAMSSIGQTGGIALYMATHTYGNVLMYPWDYTYLPAPTKDDMQTAGDVAADAIRAINGTNYVVGQGSVIYFIGYATSMDYAYSLGNIPLVYTWELTAGGSTGFDPPRNEIDPIASEAWEGIKQLSIYAAAH
ncbi:hypothetical protein B566_EDAN017338 [Ephemera danica]|nr:hypothetical protein B566_EDAN017338 [Ephemera danica]